MTMRKERLTVTVDGELVEAGLRAVKAGRAESLSGWVNDALVEREERRRRLRAMSDAIAAYEKQHGVISEEEVAVQKRADERAAVVVRGPARGAAQSKARRRTRA